MTSGEEESCTNDTRIQQVRKQGRAGDLQGSCVRGASDPSENGIILRHELRKIGQTAATIFQHSGTHHNVMSHWSPETDVVAENQPSGAVDDI